MSRKLLISTLLLFTFALSLFAQEDERPAVADEIERRGDGAAGAEFGVGGQMLVLCILVTCKLQ